MYNYWKPITQLSGILDSVWLTPTVYQTSTIESARRNGSTPTNNVLKIFWKRFSQSYEL